jgi:hypothetical protein
MARHLKGFLRGTLANQNQHKIRLYRGMGAYVPIPLFALSYLTPLFHAAEEFLKSAWAIQNAIKASSPHIGLLSARLATKIERNIYYDTDSYFG